jgi:flagellar biosynthesis protein FliR
MALAAVLLMLSVCVWPSLAPTWNCTPENEPLSRLILLWVGLLGYMAAGGPVWLFAALAHSFQNGIGIGSLSSWAKLAALGGTLLSASVGLSLPVLAVSLCVNLTVRLATVFSPQMNLLTIGFPLLIFAGLWVMAGSVGYIPHVLQQLMLLGMNSVAQLIHG